MNIKFESFTFGKLTDQDQETLDNELDFYGGTYEFKKATYKIKKKIKEGVTFFKKAVPIFDKIHIQLIVRLQRIKLQFQI